MMDIINSLIAHHIAIVRKSVLFIVLLLTLSCATKKYRVATSMTDVNSGKQLDDRSIGLNRGKICYVFNLPGESQLPDYTTFKEQHDANFIPSSFGFTPFGGGTSSLHTIDTTISNPLIVQTALMEAIAHILPGFEFMIVSQDEFKNDSGELNIDLLSIKHNPDFIINLFDLILKISGDAKTGTTIDSRQQIMPQSSGLHTTTSTHTNHYGYILMDYTANWEIIQIAEKQKKSISQSGRYISQYIHRYDLRDEIFYSAKKVGREFSQLIYELR